MPTSRKRDDNGFLLVEGCPITSYGIFDYGAGQLGLEGDPNRIVKVFRPESAVMDPAAIESFKNVPLINDHEMLSGFSGDESATAPEDYGVSGILTGNVYYQAPWMRGDIKVFSREMQESLMSGKKDLSLGYSCDFEPKPGVWQGQPYEVVQTNMRGNHIALVDEGRVPGARVLDGLCFDHLNFAVRPSKPNSTKEDEMKRKGKAFDNAVQQLKALLPALEQYLNEEASEPAHGGAGEATPAAGAEADAGGASANPVTKEAPAAGGGEGSGEAAAAPANTDPTAEIEGAAPAAADPAPADPAAADPAASGEAAPAAADPAAAGGEQDIASLITEVEGVLAKLKAAMAGGQVGDEDMGNEGELNSTDSVEGLQGENTGEGAAVCVDDEAGAGEGQGHASAGPSAGQHATASDAALRSFYADLAAKTGLYDRLSSVVGAFDCKAMDARQVAVYGVKKLGLKAAAGTESIALDAYLNGIEAAAKTTKQRVQQKAADSAHASDDMDAYLKGAK